MSRHWTRAEEIEACTLRCLGHKNSAIARRMGRSETSIRHRLKKLMPTYQRIHRPGELARNVKRLHARGYYDAEIARRLGISRSGVWRVRKELGLPKLLGSSDHARIASEAAARARRTTDAAGREFPQCWSCPATLLNGMALRKEGWVSRSLPEQPSVQEIYCRDCFARWGWPDLVRAM